MQFVASHISFSSVEDGWVLALADSVDGGGSTNILISFGEEGEQDRALGLTGLFVATNGDTKRGYGLVEKLTFDGEVLTVHGRNGYQNVCVVIGTEMMSANEILDVVERCNAANASKPENAV
ncbi:MULTISPECIES: hypothetical protein [unclassified Sphingopyxis]|uniref:hypothetical protein n=1 Tax=unclassified Sphingopyxis TaxID=2614943 RepID=UPI002854467D|nr:MULTISPECIES: hypothetical protein [unclassified Sphingopyxis]MDR6831743.1 hypothetical protein [Sphingopyxis sp. BE122]MDR7227485.1 hypothetical protein [Sphingopyxis sp. BE259]